GYTVWTSLEVCACIKSSTCDAITRLSQRWNAPTAVTPGVATMRVEFKYDAAGNMAGVWRRLNDTGDWVVSHTTYAYDDAGRVATIKQYDQYGTPTGANFTYAYDAVGRVTAAVDYGTTTSYSYDATDQLT